MTDGFITSGSTGTYQLGVDLAQLSGTILSDRFTRLLNTFWTASMAPNYVPGTTSDFDVKHIAEDGLNKGSVIQDSTLVVKSNLIYICNYGWLGLLIFSSSGLAVMAVAATLLRYKVDAPDIFAYSSSVMRAPLLESCDGGSILNTTILESMDHCVVKVKDLERGQQIGRLALMEMARSDGLAK
jgi:hypothetical protein